MADDSPRASAPDLISMVIAGDSHVVGFQPQLFKARMASGHVMRVDMKTEFIANAYGALDMVVTYPDGRSAINPIFTSPTRQWPGIGLKDRPLVDGTTAQKHLVLSIGTALSRYDPALDYEDRVSDRLLFKTGVDFILPGRPDLPRDGAAELLPVTLIREMFDTILQPMRAGLGLIAADYPGRLWVLCAPPPPRDNDILSAYLALRAKNGGFAENIELPSPAVMLKTWLLLRDSVSTICRGAGCHFIDCAAIACDETGFLKADLVHDGIHGNARYHELMANHIVSVVSAAATAP